TPWQGHKRVHHNGGLPGFSSEFQRFVDDKLTVIVLINISNTNPEKIALNVAGFYVPALTPPVLKPIPDTESAITAKVRAMIDGFVGGHLDMNLFTPDLVSWLNTEGKAGMSKAFRSSGEIQSIALVERKNQGGNRTYRYRVIYGKDSLLVSLRF